MRRPARKYRSVITGSVVVAAVGAVCLPGCQSGAPGPRATTDDAPLVSERDHPDARRAAEALVREALADEWLDAAMARLGGRPVLAVATLESERRDDGVRVAYAGELLGALARSGRVRVVAPGQDANFLVRSRLTAPDADRRRLAVEFIETATNQKVWAGAAFVMTNEREPG